MNDNVDRLMPDEYDMTPITISGRHRKFQARIYFGPKGYRVVQQYGNDEPFGGHAHLDHDEMKKAIEDFGTFATFMCRIDYGPPEDGTSTSLEAA